MSYTPTEWKSGDVVTSEKLNKLENGVAAAGWLAVHVSMETGDDGTTMTMDKTYAEIAAADQNGPVFVAMPAGPSGENNWLTLSVLGYNDDDSKYEVEPYGTSAWYADTENDYPSVTLPGPGN